MSGLVERVTERLSEARLTLALAESCTGGLVTARLTDRPGASRFLVAGVVAYANEAKVELLGVAPETIAAYGAVSEQVARAMASGARAVSGADAALAITGVAGPEGGTPEKPVGTVWIAAEVGERAEAREFHFGGDRAGIREASVRASLELLEALLETT